jgi:hypothetical protein
MSANAPVPARSDSDTVSTVDVLFASQRGRHLTIDPSIRATAFLDLIQQTARQELTYEIQVERGLPDDADVSEQLDTDEGEGRVRQRVLQHVIEWNAMLQAAVLRASTDIAAVEWLNSDGTWESLADRLIGALPDEEQQAKGGAFSQIAAFIQETAGLLRHVGIEPELVEKAWKGRARALGDISQTVNHVLQDTEMIRGLLAQDGLEFETDEEEREAIEQRRIEEYRMILLTMADKSLVAFRQWAKRRYRSPNEPPPPRMLYTTQRSRQSGRIVRIYIEATRELTTLFESRLRDHLEKRETLFSTVSPRAIENALSYHINGEWGEAATKLMRVAISGDWALSTCLDALEKAAESQDPYVRIKDITAISDITQLECEEALTELTVLLADGEHPFAIREVGTEDDPTPRWKLDAGLYG